MRNAAVFIVTLAVLLAYGPPAQAQTAAAAEPWQFTVTPYVVGAVVSGSVTVKGQEADFHVHASDFLDDLQGGFLGAFAARKGSWGVAADLLYAGLGNSTEGATVDMDEWMYAFYGLRRLSPFAEMSFGLQVTQMKVGLELSTTARSVSQSQDQTWVDPLVGVTLRTPTHRRTTLSVYSEIGGFGLGSDVTWQVSPMASVHMFRSFSLDLGYRWQAVDYATGEGADRFAVDTLANGPLLGFMFRF